MKSSAIFPLLSVVVLSFATAGCIPTSATNGSGYQFVRFTNSAAARLVAEDPTAGPATFSNNKQCKLDEACRK